MEAISNLKEPGGSNKTTIGSYIEVFYICYSFANDEKLLVVYTLSLFSVTPFLSRFAGTILGTSEF